jgi:hypothetical protein
MDESVSQFTRLHPHNASGMGRVYIYVVKYDFGFAPNPYHGICTLACCMPTIRRMAQTGDWIVGVGGRDLKSTGCCIYAMQVSGALPFDDYWHSKKFNVKRPKRNGSRVVMVGDNIYSVDKEIGAWNQADSVHSQPDGSQDMPNTVHDTSVDRVLMSDHFIYFGSKAPKVPQQLLTSLKYRNGRGYRVFPQEQCRDLLKWIEVQTCGEFNRVVEDPFQLRIGDRRYSRTANKII